MKVSTKVNNKTVVEAEGDTHTEIFEALSSLQEVFSEEICGCCKSNNIKFAARQNKDEDWFYEIRCLECYAALNFGAKKKPKGMLYPKRKWTALSPGEQQIRSKQEEMCTNGYLPDRGWWKYKKG